MKYYDSETLRDTVTMLSIEICELKSQLEDARAASKYYCEKLAETEKIDSQSIEKFYKEVAM